MKLPTRHGLGKARGCKEALVRVAFAFTPSLQGRISALHTPLPFANYDFGRFATWPNTSIPLPLQRVRNHR